MRRCGTAALALVAALVPLAVLALAMLVCALAGGATPAAAAESSGASGEAARDADLGAALDEVMAAWGEQGIAAVVVARDGEVVERLYGQDGATSDEATFSWGSIADELVWVAVMQLAEQGELRLEDAISAYLPEGVELPRGYSSLTLLDLMNHTSGLDVSPAMGTTETEGAGFSSIVPMLVNFDVEGAFDPGAFVAYSPYNVALAAAVVEQVSGEDICSYVEGHILEPLGLHDTALSAGGRPSRLAQSDDALAVALASRLVITPDLLDESLATVVERPALTCIGTVDDLVRFQGALVSEEGRAALFSSPATGEELFAVTRTYPSSGVERIAHGLFALPDAPGVYGTAGASSGYTSAAFVEPSSGSVVVALAARSTALDELLAAVRVALGVPDAGGDSAETAVGEADAEGAQAQDLSDWVGVYQPANLPAHGITKILGFFRRVFVTRDGAGGLAVNFTPTSEAGRAAVRLDDESDAWDGLFRLCVDLTSGYELSQVTADSYALPTSMLAIEVALLVGGALALLVSAVYAVVAIVGAVRDRMRGLRHTTQVGCVALALATTAVATWVLLILLGPGAERVLLSLVATRTLGLVYVVVALALLLWLGVTRWRGAFHEPRRLAGTLLVCASAVAMVLNFVYWEMLP